ncbi:MAG: SIS domain-containing protein [Acidimicrobiales bacterium]
MTGKETLEREETFVHEEVQSIKESLDGFSEQDFATITSVVAAMVHSIKAGGKVMFCGNGGSAAEAQHFAAELASRQNYDRPPAPGLALTVDSSALTAIANDYAYSSIFARQVAGLGRKGDVLVCISASGSSKNVVSALNEAEGRGITTIAMTGKFPRDLKSANYVLAMPSTDTAHVQELHLIIGHIVLSLVERLLFPAKAPESLTSPFGWGEHL